MSSAADAWLATRVSGLSCRTLKVYSDHALARRSRSCNPGIRRYNRKIVRGDHLSYVRKLYQNSNQAIEAEDVVSSSA